MSSMGRPSLGHARVAVLVLALTSAVLFVLLVSHGRSASAQTPPDPIARAWGINSFGQLGDDSNAPRNKQVPVDKAPGPLTDFLTNVTSMEGGQNHSLALKDGTVYAWGHNGFGQLGTGPISGTGTDSDVPVQVHGAGDVGFLTDVLAVAAGSNFSLAIKSDGTDDGTANDGTVWAWGDNFRGQLGNGAPGSSNTPVQVKDVVGGAGFLTDVVAVAAGGAHSLAVKSDGTVYAWGDSQFGQLGNGSSGLNAQSNMPVQVKGVGGSGFLTGVSGVAGGGLHSLAVKSDGTVYAWGYNGTGGLGNGGGPDSSTPVQVKDVGGVGFLGGVTSVAAGSEHSLALKGDGTLWAWGNNNRGQVGDGTSGVSAQRNTPVQVRSESGPGFLTGVTGIAAGAEQSLAAVSPHGTVWAWGRNEFGSLGNGSFGGDFSRPVQSIQLIGATEVAAGDFHSLAVADADTTLPETTIDPNSVPPTNSNSNSASFEFSSPATDVAGFECKLDNELFTRCLSPKSYTGLSDSSHTFQVRAKDVAGNVDSTPASHTWTVDTAAPSAPVITSPADNSFDNDGVFDISGTAESNSTVTIFEQLPGSTEEERGTVNAVSGNWSKGLSSVAEGSHTYIARTKDAAGNTSDPSNTRTVTVDKTGPTLDTDNGDGSDGVFPDNGATGVPRTANVTATFSKVMNKDTLTTNSTVQEPKAFTLVNTKTGETVPATVICADDPCQTALLDPSMKLARRTTYRATVTSDATDLAGNPLAETSWTFKTKRK